MFCGFFAPVSGGILQRSGFFLFFSLLPAVIPLEVESFVNLSSLKLVICFLF